MTDLDAIRARDAETTPYVVREGEYAHCKAAMADRRALLAEVDRLTAEVMEWGVTNVGLKEWGAEEERARIHAAVEALWTADLQEGSGEASHKMVDRAAVLAIVKGE
jgi:hypothetical protein